jgi:hypothetical protein
VGADGTGGVARYNWNIGKRNGVSRRSNIKGLPPDRVQKRSDAGIF